MAAFITLFLLLSTFTLGSPPARIDGAYRSYQSFMAAVPQVNGNEMIRAMNRNLGGNVLTFPLDSYDSLWGIVYKGELYIRLLKNVRSNELPLRWAPARTHLFVTARWDAAFVRVIKHGKLCLTAENTIVKLPGRSNFAINVFNFKKLIADDRELYLKFAMEKDKKLSIYRYIDLYNNRHSAVIDYEPVFTSHRSD